MAILNAKTNKKKGEVEVKVDEISALHDIIDKVYEPTIRFQKERIIELETEVKSLKKQLAEERADRQREMNLVNRRILDIVNALGLESVNRIRDERGLSVESEPDENQ